MTSQPIAHGLQTVVARTVMLMINDESGIPVETELRYRTGDPFAVRMLFSIPGKQTVEWVFARELLIDGVQGPAGLGDVQIYPVTEGIVLEFCSPAGQARLIAEDEAVAAFAAHMLAVVPRGAEGEYFDIDDELAALDAPGSAQF